MLIAALLLLGFIIRPLHSLRILMTLSKERTRQRVTASTDIPRSSIFYTEDSTLLCRLLTKPKLSRRFRAVARWSLAVCSESARIMWRSSRYVIRRIPKSRRVAITGFMALLNVLGALASPNVRHANSHSLCSDDPQVLLISFPDWDSKVSVF